MIGSVLFLIDSFSCEWDKKGRSRHLLLIKIYVCFNLISSLLCTVLCCNCSILSVTPQTTPWSVATIIILILQMKLRLRKVKMFSVSTANGRAGMQTRFRCRNGGCTYQHWEVVDSVFTNQWVSGLLWDQQSQNFLPRSLMPYPKLILIYHGRLRVSLSTCPLHLSLHIFPNHFGEVLQMMQRISVAAVGKYWA